MTRKPKLKYELIDAQTGRTLISGSSSQEVLTKAAQYILDYNIEYSEVVYIVISNGANATAPFSVSGRELRELIEDEAIDPYAYTDEDISEAEYIDHSSDIDREWADE